MKFTLSGFTYGELIRLRDELFALLADPGDRDVLAEYQAVEAELYRRHQQLAGKPAPKAKHWSSFSEGALVNTDPTRN